MVSHWRRATMFALIASLAGASLVPLEMLKDEYARCLDGTPGGFYHQSALDPAMQDMWVIHFQGGGECVTAQQCSRRLNTPLGSSKYFPPACNFSYDPTANPTPDRFYDVGGVWRGDASHLHLHRRKVQGISKPEIDKNWMTFGWWLLGDDKETNPYMWGWNHVLIPYCSQDLHSGQRRMPVHVDNITSLYFSGHNIFSAVLDRLDARGLFSAKTILLSGNSAGGMAVWLHVDWLAKRYASSRVLAAPIAGFYFFSSEYGGSDRPDNCTGLSDFSQSAWPGHWALWDSFVDASCAEELDDRPWECMLANVSYPFIKTPIFIAQSQTDEVVLEQHDCIPPPANVTMDGWSAEVRAFVQQWHVNMSLALAPVVNASKGDAVFSPACYIHTNFTSRYPRIQGISYMDALDSWINQKDATYLDDCGELCNPTC